MNKEFIPYTEALALKELGFDEPCFKYWNDYGQKSINRFQLSDSIDDWSHNYIEAPTFSQAFRWLIPQIDNEWKVCLGEEGWYIYNLENEIYYGENALKKLIEIIKQK
jgi:hypothetical protein